MEEYGIIGKKEGGLDMILLSVWRDFQNTSPKSIIQKMLIASSEFKDAMPGEKGIVSHFPHP